MFFYQTLPSASVQQKEQILASLAAHQTLLLKTVTFQAAQVTSQTCRYYQWQHFQDFTIQCRL